MAWRLQAVSPVLALSPCPQPTLCFSSVFTYSAGSRETCAQHHGRCSPHAFCTDYATGLCCHCRAAYYGNGRQCLPEGTWGGQRGRGVGHGVGWPMPGLLCVSIQGPYTA